MRSLLSAFAACILLSSMLMLHACEELIVGVGDGQAVQLHFKIPAGDDDTLSVDEINLSLSKALLGGAGKSEYSFVLPDTFLVLFPEDPDRFASEKVIPSGSYQNLRVTFGNSTDSTAESESEPSLKVTGFFKGEPFTFTVEENLLLDLSLKPPLRVERKADSLGILTLLMDYTTWFKVEGSQVWLNPNLSEHREQIVQNFLSSFSVEFDSETDDEKGIRPPVEIGLSGDATAEEHAESLEFEVLLNHDSGDTVTVEYATSDHSAKAGDDYRSEEGILTYLPGEIRKTVTVALIDDSLRESDETFTLGLKNPQNADIDNRKRRASGIIMDDDSQDDSGGQATVSIAGDVSAAEGEGSVSFFVKLSQARDTTVSVSYETSDKTANAAEDYEHVSGTLEFSPGEVEKEIAVAIFDDTIAEKDEKFTLTLKDPVLVELDTRGKSASATIIDDDN